MAELWWANVDVQPDGGKLNLGTLRQLAYEGPFALSHIAPHVMEYSSFSGNRIRRDYAVQSGSWVHSGSVLLTPHPPLSSRYSYPDNAQSIVVV
jgi:hypothetical protein